MVRLRVEIRSAATATILAVTEAGGRSNAASSRRAASTRMLGRRDVFLAVEARWKEWSTVMRASSGFRDPQLGRSCGK